jgi:hypothetical protein
MNHHRNDGQGDKVAVPASGVVEVRRASIASPSSKMTFVVAGAGRGVAHCLLRSGFPVIDDTSTGDGVRCSHP